MIITRSYRAPARYRLITGVAQAMTTARDWVSALSMTHARIHGNNDGDSVCYRPRLRRESDARLINTCPLASRSRSETMGGDGGVIAQDGHQLLPDGAGIYLAGGDFPRGRR